MDFVKRENQNVFDEDSYIAYQESLQKSQQLETPDYQHTSISMEQLHQAMQNSFGSGNFPHNLTIPFSPRQMTTLMLKSNNLTRNLHINDIPAHLPRNLSDIELAQSLVNETLSQSLSRTIHDDILARNINESILHRNLNDIDLSHSLGLSLNDQAEISRSLAAELSHNLARNDVSLIQNMRNDAVNAQNMHSELNLSQQMVNRNEIDVRRSLVIQNAQMVEQMSERNQNLILNGSLRLDQSNLRLDQSNLRLDQSNLRQDQSSLRLDQSNLRLDQSVQGFPVPLQVKTELEEDGYYYETAMPHNTFVNDVNGLQGHIEGPSEHNGNIQHQENQHYTSFNNQSNLSLPPLGPIELYTRPNYIQNYQNSNVNKDNPENLVIHRQYDNQSHESGNLKKISQDGVAEIGAKIPIEISEPNENCKPLNKINFDTDSNNLGYIVDKSENKIQSDSLTAMNIKGVYSCYKCNEILPSKRSLKQHTKTCIETPDLNSEDKSSKYSCSNCSYRCQSPAILKIHERTHSGEKPFACSFCDYKSGQKNNVAKHILVHMKEKPFRCQYCDYRCAQKNNLVVHERTHTGFKPFACTFCDYRTVQKPNLVKHMYLHTDQKPFSCDQCSYRCVQKTNLTKHKQRHTNENGAEKVDFQNKPYRPRQKSLKCPQCPYKCVQKSSLDKHVTFKHGDSFPEILDDGGIVSYQQGLNLMKNCPDIVETDGIQNLSVRRDVENQRDPLSDSKVDDASSIEDMELQS